MMILRNWSGCRNSRRNRFRARICRSCSWYRVWERKTMLHRLKRVTRTRLCSTRKCRFEARLGASGHVGPHATGPLASLSSLPTPRRRLLTPTPVRSRRRRGGERLPSPKAAARGGSACIAPRTRPRSGGLGPWAQKRSAMRAAWGTSRAGSSQSTGPRRAQRLFWRSTRIRTARCWNCGGKRKWWRSSSISFSNCINRTWCSMCHHPTVRITWSISTWAPITRTSSRLGNFRWRSFGYF